MSTITGQRGNGANGADDGRANYLQTEHRLTRLEIEHRDIIRRMDNVEAGQISRHERERERDKAYAQTVTIVKRLMRDVEKLSSDQQRFIIGAALALGGIVISILRAKLGV